MLTHMEVHGRAGLPVLIFALHDSSQTLQIREIEGLDPVKASLSTSPFATASGEFFTGGNIGKRNIVLKIGANPNWKDVTIEGLRTMLYTYFMTTNPVTLKFTGTHFPKVKIDGFVEGMEPDIFSKDPEIQISIICPDPDFVADVPTVVEGLVEPGWEGDPSENGGDVTEIDYPGNVISGFELRISSTPETSTYTGQIQIANVTVDDYYFTVEGTVDSTHDIKISTIVNNKYVYIVDVSLPDNPVDSILQTVPILVPWPTLRPGINEFFVGAETPEQAWELTYSARFGGL